MKNEETFKRVQAMSASTTASTTARSCPIGPAASKLAAAAYPFITDVDWTSDLALQPIPGATPQTVRKAVDKMIVMGATMDGGALKEAAEAHVRAIHGVDATGGLSQSDFEAINIGWGQAIASVPTNKVMDVYNAVTGVSGRSPQYDVEQVEQTLTYAQIQKNKREGQVSERQYHPNVHNGKVDALDGKIEVDSDDRADKVVEVVGSFLSFGSLSAKPAPLRANGQSRRKEATAAV